MRFRFADCHLDTDAFELRRAGEPVEVQPKVLDLLIYLLENRHRTVTKRELLDTVWPGVAIGESSLTRAISAARSAIGQGSRTEGVIRTVHGRGYRIAVDVVQDAALGPLAPPATTDLVCREQELRLAAGSLDEALAGRTQVLLLAGEPGIGKTRLAEEICADASARGALVYWGRCSQGEGAPAFWPWIQILRAYLTEREPAGLHAHLGDGAADVADLVPEVRERLPEATPPAGASDDEDGARFRILDGVTRLLRAACADDGLVLVLDDLHLADGLSLKLLRFLADGVGQARLLILCAYRDVALEPGDPLADALAELARARPRMRSLALRGFARDCTKRFIEHVGAVDQAPDSLVDAVQSQTDGNPLFMRELVHWLQATRGDEWTGASGLLEIPQGIQQVIGQRLRGLSADCTRALEHAAVIGREFPLALLARVAQTDERELLDELDRATAAGIVSAVRDSAGLFRFAHPLLRQVLYEGLGPARRADLHRRVGIALEEMYTPRPIAPTNVAVPIEGGRLAELAHHFAEAVPGGDADKAIGFCERAGHFARSVRAFEAAAEHYDRALRILNATQPHDVRRGALERLAAEASRRKIGKA